MEAICTESEVIEGLPGDLRHVAEVAGVEAAIRLALVFKGTTLYVPSLDGFMRAARDEAIRREYDGGRPVRRLALKYSLTERTIRKIVDSPGADMNPRIVEIMTRLTARSGRAGTAGWGPEPL